MRIRCSHQKPTTRASIERPCAQERFPPEVVYTQLTGVAAEVNGMLTYDREVIKMDPRLLSQLHN